MTKQKIEQTTIKERPTSMHDVEAMFRRVVGEQEAPPKLKDPKQEAIALYETIRMMAEAIDIDFEITLSI